MPNQNQKNKSKDPARATVQLSGFDEMMTLINTPHKLAWLRFYSGLMGGIGATLGAAFALVLLGFAIKHLGGVPWIGDLLHQIGNAAQVQ